MAGVKANAQSASQAWHDRFAQSGPKYAAGIDAVTVSPGQLAANAADDWANNVVNAKAKFKANVSKVQLQDWKNSAKNIGGARLASGADKGLAKVQAFQTVFLPVLGSVVDSLPAGGSFEKRMQRFNAYATALHAKAGSFS